MNRAVTRAPLLMLIFAIASCATERDPKSTSAVESARHDVSAPLRSMRIALAAPSPADCGAGSCGTAPDEADGERDASTNAQVHAAPPVLRAAADIEQTEQGSRPAAKLIASFDGLGFGFDGPQGGAVLRNPSDNTLAVGPNHVVEIVNTRMAIYTKKGAAYDTTGRVLYGAVPTNTIFTGFGGRCEPRPNGDAVVRYDQLADRWLYVMPIFNRPPGEPQGPYSMCYAVSVSADPLGPYYRYEFKRPLFPDYPRPAIWPDGYYVPTSTGDDVIQKHACVVDRVRMLQGLPATEQCVIIDGVNFLNNADIDGRGLPPAGAPNIMMAAGGSQLKQDFDDDGIYVWKFHVDWTTPANTKVTGPVKLDVAPYHYLCNGQLTNCVPQPGTERRLDAQGDKLMNRLVYRNVNGRESIVGLHSVNTAAGGGGVRWYEFRLDDKRDPYLFQQSTYAPDGFYRWMGSMGMDRQGNIGIGYSFGGTPNYAGQRFAARLADDPPGSLTLREAVLVEGKVSQTNTLRWQDYTALAMDPVDDCTFWYVGDYLKAAAPNYTTRIGAFRLPGCMRGEIRGSVFFDVDHDGYRDPGEPGVAGAQVAYAGGGSGTLTVDTTGRFSTWLPADPAFGSATYAFTVKSPAPQGLVRSTLRGGGRRAVTAAASSFTVRLADRDEVTAVDFGYSCVTGNTGGMAASYWNGADARNILRTNAAAVRRLLGMTLYIVNADSTRVVADTSAASNAKLQAMFNAAGANLSHSASAQLAAVALNVAYGKQDGNAAVLDPVQKDWVSINTAIARVSAFIAAHPMTSAGTRDAATMRVYVTLLRSLNDNTATVTPARQAGCTKP